jgi:(1->4)-alpha-D-glucan 1-alpha-D-glucosylmutase
MLKAVREAKQRTSWTEPDAAYEEALQQFIRSVLEPRDGNLFLVDFLEFQRGAVRFGLLNSLSQTLCKLTAPGVPDVYQGNEIWDFSLVDPDNRRPVDYLRRRTLLEELREHAPAARELAEHMEDGRCKLLLTWRVLELRRAHPALFRDGSYRRLRVRGEHAPNICAFSRRLGARVLIVIAPRLYRRLLAERGGLPLGPQVWGDTVIELPREQRARSFRGVLDGAQVHAVTSGDGAGVLAAQALAEFPVALLAAGCDSPPNLK